MLLSKMRIIFGHNLSNITINPTIVKYTIELINATVIGGSFGSSGDVPIKLPTILVVINMPHISAYIPKPANGMLDVTFEYIKTKKIDAAMRLPLPPNKNDGLYIYNLQLFNFHS